MKANDYWSIFLETGVPEYYVMYTQALRMEEDHVYDNPGTDASDCRLQ